MNKKLKIILSMMLIICIITSIGFAAPTAKDIKAVINETIVKYNNNEIKTDTLIYNGVLYVPAKTLSETFGKQYSWDDKNRTANINEKSQDVNKVSPTKELKSLAELKKYLQENFSELNTTVGKTKFTFYIIENTKNYTAYDYWVQVEYDFSFFTDLKYSNKFSDEQRKTVQTELKDFMEKLAKSVIQIMPNKKFEGGYYYSWYKYPALKADLQVRRYYSWTNYDTPDILNTPFDKIYSEAKLGNFRWYEKIDDDF